MTIEEYKISDLNAVIEISDQQFGNNYLTESDLQHYFSSVKSHILVARDNNKVIGFSIIILGYFEEILREVGQEYYEFLKSLEKSDIVRLHKTTAVHQDYVNQGIGSALIKNIIINYNADLYLSLIWKRKTHVPMLHIITKLGFKPLCEIANYWNKSSLTKFYHCPECGKPPCTCSLIIMYKREMEPGKL